MRFIDTGIPDAKVIDPTVHQDFRGRFMRAWCEKEFLEHNIKFRPVQSNMGFSIRRGTIRGMHSQKEPAPEAKLVRCTRGSIFDDSRIIEVSLRPQKSAHSRSYGLNCGPESSSPKAFWGCCLS